MYFENHSGAEEIRWLSTGLPSMLVTGLAQTPGLDVVSSQRIHEILKHMGQEDLENIDKSLVADVARRAGAGAVVVGSIFKAGDEIRIDVQLEDVDSGKVLSADTVRGADVFPLVDELAGRIRRRSLEAYQLYSEGVEAFRNLRDVDARGLLEKALELDPSFAMAQFQLSRIFSRLDQDQLADEHLEKVMAHLDKLPERQKLMVQAERAHGKREYEKAAELLESLVTNYPDEADGYQRLQHVYTFHLEQADKELDAIERGVNAVPQSGILHNQYGYVLLRRGRYPEAVREFETYASLNPGEPNAHDSLGEAYLITGQPEKAAERFARSLEVDPTFFDGNEGLAWAYVMLGKYDEALTELDVFGNAVASEGLPPNVYHFVQAYALSRVGRYREAEDQTRKGVSGVESSEDAGWRVEFELLSALLSIEQKSYPRAVERVERVERLFSQIPDENVRNARTVLAHLLAGAAETLSGNLAAARKRLDAQGRLDLSWQETRWWHRALEGEIALAEGDLAAAESAFLAGEPDVKMPFNRANRPLSVFGNALLFRDGVARVKRQQGDLAGAIEIYRKLNTPDIGNKWTALLEPRYVLELARLLDETGQKDAARTEYERFLELWKNADEGLPELKEARGYLAK
jgi:tetratricopeptide (TPR) repeat protein